MLLNGRFLSFGRDFEFLVPPFFFLVFNISYFCIVVLLGTVLNSRKGFKDQLIRTKADIETAKNLTRRSQSSAGFNVSGVEVEDDK